MLRTITTTHNPASDLGYLLYKHPEKVQTCKLLEPAVKDCWDGYLCIIYGPEYTTLERLAELRQRNVTLKRTLALREFALGIEALERFVDRQPLRRVHECAFGVLALESEPVDPML